MPNKEVAEALYQLGRAHSLSGNHLFAKAIDYAIEQKIPDPDHFAFNGTFSLSTYYLLGLGIELLVKAAYVASGGESDDKHLRNAIGHDLQKALEQARSVGFETNAPRLNGIVGSLSEPYKQHFFRYAKPTEMGLPIVPEVVEALVVLDEEVEALIGSLGDPQ
ncbi:hypothetical protein G6N82_12590 [Altererythrobacter sp. BO-6]|uniref:hypothetical protein n=1 Tax=Altererythrobacter sp. BO-6 TaxID=2604537 RepID=UPI0013E196C4|nr:hypothetical protein [Altererythrobacter sp. BO-6]QIG54879.1 hypothetical protein G6N82_12590 [Altererythrobacter sp. BO-6]